MKVDWAPLRAELAIWRTEQRVFPIWWRDDDAVTKTPALDRLASLAAALQMPAHLAVIPKFADAELVQMCGTDAFLIPMVHGWSHQNHALSGQKKAEFGHMRADLIKDAERGLQRIKSLFKNDFLPCFVPPWNRITPDLLSHLTAIGYTCVSTYTPRQSRLAHDGLVQINTHIDPINWRGGGLVDPEMLTQHIINVLQDRRLGRTDAREPLGFLTHHLVHDADMWAFTEDCLKVLLDSGAIPLNLLILKDDLP